MENTISVKEFKAWLEGFEESFSSYQPYPNKEQWEKIMNKVHQLQEGRADSQYYDLWQHFNNLQVISRNPHGKGDLYCGRDVGTSVKEAPDGPGYI